MAKYNVNSEYLFDKQIDDMTILRGCVLFGTGIGMCFIWV